jgi:hypothetical protein
MEITYESQCTTCKNEISDVKCKAYPKRMPRDIWEARRKDCKFYKSIEEEK